MNYNNLLINLEENIATVTINRPDKLNALNSETMSELKTAFEELENNDKVYVIILTGAGEKAFVAGADISELNKLDALSGKVFAEKGQAVFNTIEKCKKPVIAAVNGFALGGGSELAWSCHIRYCSENAKFGQPEVNLGIIPGYGGTQRLTRLINSGRSMEIILTGDMFDANEAFRLGVVSRVYPISDLLLKVKETAKKIASKGQIAVQLGVQAVKAADETALSEGQAYEAVLFAACCGTEDFKEGTSAFLEKRKAEFKFR